MSIKVYLYNADGTDEEIEFDESICQKLNDHQLLWVNILERDENLLRKVASALKLENLPLRAVLYDNERPKVEKFNNYYRMFIASISLSDEKRIKRHSIDFIVGKNFVVTVHDGEVEYFKEYRDREKGETTIGELDAESFIGSLLDLHIATYFRALERIEARIDKLDEEILKTDMKDRKLLGEMLALRNDVSRLRRWLVPHRDVFHHLARSDFKLIAESDSANFFKFLIDHLENSISNIESSRDTVLSLFDLYATRSAQKMNRNMQRLTFITLVFGAMAVIVGAFGMNFEVQFFKVGDYFWLTVLGMLIVSVFLTILAKTRDWI